MSLPTTESPETGLDPVAASTWQRLASTAALRVEAPGRTRKCTDLVLDAQGLWQGRVRFSDLSAWLAWLAGRQAASDGKNGGDGARQTVRIHIAAELLHEWPCDPALPLADDAARLAWARRLQEQYHGADAASWPQAVWSGRGHGVTAWQCAQARASEPLRAWRALARSQGIGIASVTPLWRAALLYARASHPPLAKSPHSRLLLVEGALVTHIELARGKPVSVMRRRLAQPDVASLQAFVQTLPPQRQGCCVALGAGLALPPGSLPDGGPRANRAANTAANTAADRAADNVANTAAEPALVTLGDLMAPLPWLPPAAVVGWGHSTALKGPDFLRPGRPVSPWPALATFTGALMLTFVAWEARSLHALEQGQVRAAQVQPAPAAADRGRHPRAGALNFPWPALLQSMESATAPGLHWTHLTADAQGRVTAQGRAESDSAVRELAQRLRSTNVWLDVTVARSEVAPPGWQFEISARVAAGAGWP